MLSASDVPMISKSLALSALAFKVKRVPADASIVASEPTPEPELHHAPPAELGVGAPNAAAAQGREVWRLTGAHDWSSPDTAALLAEAGR